MSDQEHIPIGKCELCGKIAGLRPYGPNDEEICITCGFKDELTTRKKCREVMGLTPEEKPGPAKSMTDYIVEEMIDAINYEGPE